VSWAKSMLTPDIIGRSVRIILAVDS